MKRYLIVDDDDMSRLMLKEFLAEVAECDMAVNGRDGLGMFEKALSEGRPYDLVCIDLIMPEMNGLAMVRKVREVEKTYPIFTDFRTKVFVITANDSPWDKADLVFENLCDDYIVKPFSRDSMLEKLVGNQLI